jgi:cysteine-S-conjugate beta-lyase
VRQNPRGLHVDVVGHSDVMLSAVTTTKEMYEPVRAIAAEIGHCAGPDNIYLAFARAAHSKCAARTAPKERARRRAAAASQTGSFARALPALPEESGHTCGSAISSAPVASLVWRRSETGDKTCGLRLIDILDLIGIGASWRRFESLVQPTSAPPPAGKPNTRCCAHISVSKIHRI